MATILPLTQINNFNQANLIVFNQMQSNIYAHISTSMTLIDALTSRVSSLEEEVRRRVWFSL